jgi:hypothetical protein
MWATTRGVDVKSQPCRGQRMADLVSRSPGLAGRPGSRQLRAPSTLTRLREKTLCRMLYETAARAN